MDPDIVIIDKRTVPTIGPCSTDHHWWFPILHSKITRRKCYSYKIGVNGIGYGIVL